MGGGDVRELGGVRVCVGAARVAGDARGAGQDLGRRLGGAHLESSALALLRKKRGQVVGGNPNRVADAEVLEVAALAEAIDRRGAHAEELGHLTNRKQCPLQTLGGKML